MQTESTRDRRRRLTTLLPLLVLASGGVIWLARDWETETVSAPPATATPGEPNAPAPAAPTILAARGPEPSALEVAGAEPPTEPVRETAPLPPILCLEGDTRAPLSGVRLYSDGEAVDGPSDAAGVLAVSAAREQRLVLWAKGWLPAHVRGDALPAEVSFAPADGSLELRLVNATYDHRMLRTLLQPKAPVRGAKGPWVPRFEERSRDLWVADGLVPGEYDLYAWIVYPDGEPRAFSQHGIEVEVGVPAHHTIDLDTPRTPDEFEDDS